MRNNCFSPHQQLLFSFFDERSAASVKTLKSQNIPSSTCDNACSILGCLRVAARPSAAKALACAMRPMTLKVHCSVRGVTYIHAYVRTDRRRSQLERGLHPPSTMLSELVEHGLHIGLSFDLPRHWYLEGCISCHTRSIHDCGTCPYMSLRSANTLWHGTLY